MWEPWGASCSCLVPTWGFLLADTAEQMLWRSMWEQILPTWRVFKPRSFLPWSWDFLVLCTGVGVESSPKVKIIAGCRVSRFSYLNVLNTFTGVLCFLDLCQKCSVQFCCSCWIVAIFNATVVNGNGNMERNTLMFSLIFCNTFWDAWKGRAS